MATARRSVSETLRALPAPLACALVAAAASGAVGGVVGLGLGLRAYAPTAWFAVLEVGLPSAVGGALLGLVAGSLAALGASPGGDRPVARGGGRPDRRAQRPGLRDRARGERR